MKGAVAVAAGHLAICCYSRLHRTHTYVQQCTSYTYIRTPLYIVHIHTYINVHHIRHTYNSVHRTCTYVHPPKPKITRHPPKPKETRNPEKIPQTRKKWEGRKIVCSHKVAGHVSFSSSSNTPIKLKTMTGKHVFCKFQLDYDTPHRREGVR